MTGIHLNYPHSPLSAVPDRLSARQVWAVARALRKRVSADAFQRRFEVESLAGLTGVMVVNGVEFGAHWDFEHEVRNEADQPVMGTTEFDPAQPDSVMVSINGVALAGRDEVLRSTIAHEVGHVVFDAPSWIRGASTRRMADFQDQPEGNTKRKLVGSPGQRGARDWREFRANEFMGALLVPMPLIRLDLLRFAKRHRFPPSPFPSRVASGAPAYDSAALDPDAMHELLFTLAERYGVSEPFVRVRLDRYDLLRSGFAAARGTPS
jgi:hypothetical protein